MVMLSVIPLTHGAGFAVNAVTCHNDHTRWSEPEMRAGYDLVLVRRGRFQRRADGVAHDVDPTLAYIGRPDRPEQFAHPYGGDTCTWIHIDHPLWMELTGDPDATVFYVDARVDLIHRRLLAGHAEPTESIVDILAALLHQIHDRTPIGRTPASAHSSTSRRSATDASYVARARAAIGDQHPQSHALLPLADLLGVSPYRLSRAFTRELGVSLSRYRNRIRLGLAMDRLEQGEENLARLAADLGFTDQAHLCRTARQHLGQTPTSIRRLLRA